MTIKSRVLGASIGCGLVVVYLVLFPGCSFAPDDAVAATNSTDSPNEFESPAETPNIDDAAIGVDEAPDEATSTNPNRSINSNEGARRNISDEDGKRSEGTIKQTGSSTSATDTAEIVLQKNNANKTFELTFDDLAFEMEKTDKFKRSMLTEKINGYDGGTVRLRGFIRPSFSQSGLTKFVFVRDNKECCFGPGAALYDCVLVRLAKGKKTEFTVRPVTIEGKFYLKEYKGPDGKVWSIYRMKDAFVR